MSTRLRRKPLFALAWLGALLTLHGCAPAERTQPDIVILLADDLGWRDVGFRSEGVETPNLDRLAARGVRLDACYALPMCTPTRAALLTGRYPMRMGLQADVFRPWSRRGLPLAERTLAEGLRDAGYQTDIVGKWHLGHHEPAYLPMQRGFDHHYGSYCGLIDYRTHERLGGLDWHRDGKGVREEGHTTDLIASEAVRILESRAPRAPLFLYVAFNAPHAPNQPPADCASLYENVESAERRAYLAQVTCLDRAIGRVLDSIDAEHTLVVFMSDNGGDVTYGAQNAPLRGEKGKLYEGGVRVNAIVQWAGQLAPAVVTEPIHAVDWYPTLLKLAGANVVQTLPLDGVDVWPILAGGKSSSPREILINVDAQRGAILDGPWKLVVSGQLVGTAGGEPTIERAELFDLSRDASEEHDLSASEPARVRALFERLCAYARESLPSEGGALDAQPPGYAPPKVWGE
jgi:arylsulfatase A-like enzyme